jgi:hypothetical protein
MCFKTTIFRRTILFSVLSILGAGWLSAQSSMCNQLSIEVCEVPQPQGSMPQGCMDGDKCSPVYFYFYLKAAGTGGNSSVSFKQISVTGQLVASPNLLATGKVLSQLNPVSSLQCSPPDINNPNDPASPTLSLDADGSFSYHVMDNNDLNVNWILQSNRKLLFVIAIDPFPGEQVTLGGIAFSFVLPVYTSHTKQPRESRKSIIFPPSNRVTCVKVKSVTPSDWKYWLNGIREPV